jgi:hypothetical protein
MSGCSCCVLQLLLPPRLPLLPLPLLLLLLQVLMKPDLVGPGGTATSFFGLQDAAGVWRFYGTAAAAPNVAAVAALMIRQNSSMTVGAQACM